MPKTIDPNKARQGRSGTRVLTILISALILALIVWWGVGLYGSAIQPEDPVGGVPAEQPAEPVETPPAAPAEE